MEQSCIVELSERIRLAGSLNYISYRYNGLSIFIDIINTLCSKCIQNKSCVQRFNPPELLDRYRKSLQYNDAFITAFIKKAETELIKI